MIAETRSGILSRLFALAGRARATRIVQQWRRAAADYPSLVPDLVALAGLHEEPRSLDPQQMAFDAGRRALALSLLARMGASDTDIRTALEYFDHDRHERHDDNDGDFLRRDRDAAAGGFGG